jgi:hypothetical protein
MMQYLQYSKLNLLKANEIKIKSFVYVVSESIHYFTYQSRMLG